MAIDQPAALVDRASWQRWNVIPRFDFVSRRGDNASTRIAQNGTAIAA
jgi:hypothetical protein